MALNIKGGNTVNTVRNLSGATRDWQSLTVEIPGSEITLTGVAGLRYGQTQDTQLNYGIGVNPVSKGFGNVTSFGEITMALWQIDDLLASITEMTDDTRRPQNIAPFNLIVSWFNASTGETIQDTLYQCSIDNFEKSINQGDMDSQFVINLNPIGIEFNKIA